MKTTVSIFVALIFSASLYAQDYAFKVLVNKGRNEIKSGTTWQPIKVGASLRSPDELRVSENAYIGLIHVSGKPLELKSAGKYKVADLSAKIGNNKSVLNKYTDFILSTNTQKQNNLHATGAVHRGAGKVTVYLPPSSSYVYGDTIMIEWEKEKDVRPPYEITFTSLFGDELYKMETSENSITVDLSNPAFSRENDISVKIFSKEDRKESELYTLRKFSSNDRQRMKASFNELAKETTAETAINYLFKAAFFEQNKLIADAVTAYKKAIALEPEVQSYKEAYRDFLLCNGLKQEPAKK